MNVLVLNFTVVVLSISCSRASWRWWRVPCSCGSTQCWSWRCCLWWSPSTRCWLKLSTRRCSYATTPSTTTQSEWFYNHMIWLFVCQQTSGCGVSGFLVLTSFLGFSRNRKLLLKLCWQNLSVPPCSVSNLIWCVKEENDEIYPLMLESSHYQSACVKDGHYISLSYSSSLPLQKHVKEPQWPYFWAQI